MATLDGVGHGTVLAGRYRLEERLHVAGTTAMWRAADTVLDRAVGVRLVVGGHAPDTLDAARRAALVEDPRLLRVLDVGTDALPDPPGSTAATRDEVAYVVSEFVEGQSLTTRLRQGPLRASQMRAVIGEAAEALEVARVAGLHHTCLTPSSIILTPGDDVKLTGLGVDATLDPSAAPVEDSDAAARMDAVLLVAVLYAGLTGRWPLGSVDGLPEAPQVAGQPAAPADLVPGVPNDLDTLCSVTLGPHDDGPHTPGELAEQLAPWGRRTHEDPEEVESRRPAARFPASLAAAAGTVGAAAATAAAAAGLRTEPGGRESEPVRGERGSTATTTRAEARPHVVTDSDGRAGRTDITTAATATGSSLLFGRAGGLGPPDPGGWDDTGGVGEDDEEQRRQSRIVLIAVGVLVALGLGFAISSLSSIGGSGEPAPPPAAAPEESEAEEPAEPEPQPEPEPEPEPVEAPASIQGVRTLDPQGDNVENDDQATLAIDDDPGTAWNSSTYNNESFGNLKDGLGFVVDLGRESTLNGVDLLVNGSGGSLEVRTAPGPSYDDSEVVATAELDGEPLSVELEEPVETQFVVLWFTRLPDTGDGYRIELAQVQVR